MDVIVGREDSHLIAAMIDDEYHNGTRIIKNCWKSFFAREDEIESYFRLL